MSQPSCSTTGRGQAKPECTRAQNDRCKSELYMAMPGTTAAASLRLLQTHRETLIRQMSSSNYTPAGWTFLFGIIKAVTALKLWAAMSAPSGMHNCFHSKHLQLRDWANTLFLQLGSSADWDQAIAWGERVQGSTPLCVRNTQLDAQTGICLQRLWNEMLTKMRSQTELYAYWLSTLNTLPGELAVLKYWTH